MLNELALECYESGIYEFSALAIGDGDFEDLSPRAKVVVLDMLATIRELQARVAEFKIENASLRDAPTIPSNPILDGQVTSAGLAEYLWQQRQAILGESRKEET